MEFLIWKFPIDRPKNTYGKFELSLPMNSVVLDCQLQNDQLCLWVLFPNIDPLEYETKYFNVVGTGKPFEFGSLRDYIATVQQPPFVWHVFREWK